MIKKSSKIIHYLKTGVLFKTIYLKYWLKKNHNKKSPIEIENKIASCRLNYRFNLLNPRSFNEKIAWLKHFYTNDLWKRCADKLEVKAFLKEIGLEEVFPKTLKTYVNSKEIDLNLLPKKFVLKTNHDSGSVYLCDKEKTNFDKVFLELDSSINKSYSKKSSEWVYENISPVIFAEEVLIPESGDDLIDFKFFCFKGKPKFLFCGMNRSTDIKFSVHNATDFSIINCSYIYPKPKQYPKKPKCYNQMLLLAEAISKHFEFVRVDLYATNKGPMVGELTFFSQSGHGKFTPTKYDFEFGKLFDVCDFDFNKNIENNSF